MKTSILFFVISVSLIITSCSQLDQETSPIGPQINKTSETLNTPTIFPYTYLSSFPELNSVKWGHVSNDDGLVYVKFSKPVKDFNQIFCEIIYSDINETTSLKSELYFAGIPLNNEFSFAVSEGKIISDINLYAVYSYLQLEDILPANERPKLPYNIWQEFNSITVNEWEAKGETIFVNASDELINNQHVYAKIVSKQGSILVVLGKPSTSTFDIPKYGDLNIEDLDLFGFGHKPYYDTK